jgi:hypothetical protein
MRSHFNGWQDYSWVLKRVIDFHCTLHKHELTGWQTCTHTVLSPRQALHVVLQNIAGAIDSTFELLVKFLSRCVSKKCINRRLKLENCYLSAEGFFVPNNKGIAAPGHLKWLEYSDLAECWRCALECAPWLKNISLMDNLSLSPGLNPN